jgi:hypothetical protein
MQSNAPWISSTTFCFFSLNLSNKTGKIDFAWPENSTEEISHYFTLFQPFLKPFASNPTAFAAFETTTTFASPEMSWPC